MKSEEHTLLKRLGAPRCAWCDHPVYVWQVCEKCFEHTYPDYCTCSWFAEKKNVLLMQNELLERLGTRFCYVCKKRPATCSWPFQHERGISIEDYCDLCLFKNKIKRGWITWRKAIDDPPTFRRASQGFKSRRLRGMWR